MAKATTVKRAAKAASAAAETKVRPAPRPKAKPTEADPKVARPSVAMHNLPTAWSGGTSGVGNSRVSRTPLPLDRFGTLTDAPLTERDRENLGVLRQQFGGGKFQRANIDAGILRRLGERGFLEHVSGAANEATAVFRLTNRKAA